MQPVWVGGIPIGDGHPAVFMAEIGTFFNQDVELAARYIRQVKEAGVDILKGEVLHNPDICLNDETLEHYHTGQAGLRHERYRHLIERKVLPLDRYRKLFQVCRELKIPFVLSVYDREGVDFVKDVGGAALKIASSNIVHAPLIRYAAASGLPIFFDTGKALLEEVARAVRWARDAGGEDFIVHHNPDGHPALPQHHDMRIMQAYKAALDVPVGLSDHHVGDEMLYLAIGMGANVLEKPVCDDPAMVEQDAIFALPISQLTSVVRKCRNAWLALGSPVRRIDESRFTATSQRMGLIAARDLRPGEILDESTVTFAFPNKGISVAQWDLVAGHSVRRALKTGAVLVWQDVAFGLRNRPAAGQTPPVGTAQARRRRDVVGARGRLTQRRTGR